MVLQSRKQGNQNTKRVYPSAKRLRRGVSKCEETQERRIQMQRVVYQTVKVGFGS